MKRLAGLTLGVMMMAGGSLPAQEAQMSEQATLKMAQQIQKELVTLNNYGVFDDLRFGIKGREVILRGYASRPTLKDSAEKVVKDIEGVEKVTNKIEVLGLSPNDDRVRAEVYARVYGHPTLARYNPNRGTPRWITPSRIAAGITNDPPFGFHPIHIIVKDGNVTLTGVVANSMDKSIAEIQANQSSAFSVTNDLVIEGKEQEKEYKSKKTK
jgi:osmotically-inducible protein OsmY